MSEKPILFSGEMVRTILDGRKTQTRRVIEFDNPGDWYFHGLDRDPLLWDHEKEETFKKEGWIATFEHNELGEVYRNERSPYGGPGDTLWVRETWYAPGHEDTKPSEIPVGTAIHYPASAPDGYDCGPKRPSIFMCRWMSRIDLLVKDVRVERLQEITPDDCRAEGLDQKLNDVGARYSFGALWNSINEKRGYGWDTNPWVWVVEFELEKA